MVSGTNRTAAGTACTGLSPPAVLADRPHCLRRLTARQDRFTLGLWLDECIFNPDVQIVATGPPRPAVRQTTAPPFSSFLSGIMACPFRTAFPFRAAHQTYPVDLFSSRLSPARMSALLTARPCQPAATSKGPIGKGGRMPPFSLLYLSRGDMPPAYQ